MTIFSIPYDLFVKATVTILKFNKNKFGKAESHIYDLKQNCVHLSLKNIHFTDFTCY